MKHAQALRLAMYLAVKRELQAIVTTAGTAGHSALLDVLTAQLEEIFARHEVQTTTTAPKTTTRNEALDAMVLRALVVAGPLGTHAHQHGLHEAEAVADVTAYSFNRLRLVERPTLAQKIHDAARPLLAALAPFGVTEPMLDDLQARIDAAWATLHEPRTAIIDRHEATKALARLFPAIDRLLEKQIDRAIAPLMLTHPELHRRYFDARRLPRRPRRATEAPAAAATMPAPAASQLWEGLYAPTCMQHSSEPGAENPELNLKPGSTEPPSDLSLSNESAGPSQPPENSGPAQGFAACRGFRGGLRAERRCMKGDWRGGRALNSVCRGAYFSDFR